jgi:hypothetical protein
MEKTARIFLNRKVKRKNHASEEKCFTGQRHPGIIICINLLLQFQVIRFFLAN